MSKKNHQPGEHYADLGPPRKPGRIIPFFLTIAGLGFLSFGIWLDLDFYHLVQTKHWIPLTGVYEREKVSTVETEYQGKYGAHRSSQSSTSFQYHYLYQGQNYAGDFSEAFVVDKSYEKTKNLKAGDPVQIYVNPTNPEQSGLFQGVEYSDLSGMGILFLVLFNLLSIAVIVFFFVLLFT